MRFIGSDAEIDLGSRHAEFDAFRWVEPDELPRLIVAFKRHIYVAVLNEFRDHCRAAAASTRSV